MNIELKKVVVDDVYETIHEFCSDKDMIVDDYDSMIECYFGDDKEGWFHYGP